MRSRALVYLSALHPRREQAAARGGPSGEMFMSDSLLVGLDDLGFRTNRIGALRSLLGLRMRQVLSFERPSAVFVDPWSFALARHYRALPRTERGRTLVLDWFGTTAPVAESLTLRDHLVPYPYPALENLFLGFILRLPNDTWVADEDAVRAILARNSERPRRFGVVWGKEARYFGFRERELIEKIARRIPMHLTVNWHAAEPLSGEGIVNHGHLSPVDWRELIGGACFVLGLGDPILGPTALETLLAGAVLLNPVFERPRGVAGSPGVLFECQHPFAASIGPPHVLPVDLNHHEGALRLVETVISQGPAIAQEPLTHALSTFTRERYVRRLAEILRL